MGERSMITDTNSQNDVNRFHSPPNQLWTAEYQSVAVGKRMKPSSGQRRFVNRPSNQFENNQSTRIVTRGTSNAKRIINNGIQPPFGINLTAPTSARNPTVPTVPWRSPAANPQQPLNKPRASQCAGPRLHKPQPEVWTFCDHTFVQNFVPNFVDRNSFRQSLRQGLRRRKVAG
jgi:hypothetical protein